MKQYQILLLLFITFIIHSCVSKKDHNEYLRNTQNLLNKCTVSLNSLIEENQNLIKENRNVNSRLLSMVQTENDLIRSNPENLQIFQKLLEKDNFETVDLLNISTDTSYVDCLLRKPLLLSELNSGSTKFVYTIDHNTRSSASLLGLLSGNLNRDERIAIVDYVEYKDINCSNGKYLRVAAGVRLTLKFKYQDNRFKFNIPSKLAAASEIGIAEVTYKIETIGFKNSTTRKILSGLGGEFNIDDYIKVLDAVNKIQLAMDDVTTIDPRVIPIEAF